MQLFILGPIWLLLVSVGLVLLVSARLRFLSSYLILASTVALILATILPFALLLGIASIGRALNISGESTAGIAGILALLAFVALTVIGGLLGVFVGAVLARKLNRVLGWESSNAT